MANKIQILSAQQVALIAAGEVVRNPASALKELLENSLDAGAKNLVIHFEQGGKQLLSISDDGCGMSSDDALLAVQMHATSKLRQIEDLMSLVSFGFRGEALASIGQVSRLILTTREAEAELGSCLKFEARELISQTKIVAPVGTTLEISDLFFNQPVRKQYLQKDASEKNNCLAVITSVALANLEVNFKVFSDGQMALNLPAVQDFVERVAQLFDYQLAQNLRYGQMIDAQVQCRIWFSNTDFSFFNRNKIYLFCNNRLFRDPKILSAILQGYDQLLPAGKFPAVFCFLEVDPTQIDVNIHPAKETIAFLEHNKIVTKIRNLILTSLRQTTNEILQDLLPNKQLDANFYLHSQSNIANSTSTLVQMHNLKSELDYPAFLPQLDLQVEQPQAGGFDSAKLLHYNLGLEKLVSDSQELTQNTLPSNSTQAQFDMPRVQQDADKLSFSPLRTGGAVLPLFEQSSVVSSAGPRIIGQLFATYLLCQREDNQLVIIDQHAASERIIYEKMQADFSHHEAVRLLFPVNLNLNRVEMQALQSVEAQLNEMGIQICQTGPTQLQLLSTPCKVEAKVVSDLLLEISSKLQDDWIVLDKQVVRKKMVEHVHSHLACKTAIKAGDSLNLEQMQELVKALMGAERNFECVHGRPTMHVIEKKDLEKLFRRRN